MADDARENARLPDVRMVQRLAALMTSHDLSEINMRDGTLHIRLRRGARIKGMPLVAPPVAALAPEAATPPPKAVAPEAPAKKLLDIKSPTPGTFYAQDKPGAPPYVAVGARVAPNTVVCQIEAMKIFNEITADCTGVIVEILAENKQPVEYGTVLFRVDPTA